jgi:CheY-like chemotaxis protein
VAETGPPNRMTDPSPHSNEAGLAGLRVLLVEDEAMVALLIEDVLEELGCVTVGPAARVSAALDLIDAHPVDLAVLDVNLGGETVFPVADRLADRGVPFLFSTGYGAAGLIDRHAGRPVLPKPFDPDQLGPALLALRPW